VRFDHSFEESFDLVGLEALRSLDFNLGFNEVQPDYLPPLFRQLARAERMKNVSLNLESTKVNAFHFNRAARELYGLQQAEELTLNVACNSIREEGIYAIGDLCLAMPRLTACRIIFRK
jgi:hypothetical protein